MIKYVIIDYVTCHRDMCLLVIYFQSDICVWNAESNIWKMVTCKVKGFMDPVSGQCNCDSGFVNKISNEKKVGPGQSNSYIK